MSAKILRSKLPLKPCPNATISKLLLDQLIKDSNIFIVDCPSGRIWFSQQLLEAILNLAAGLVEYGLKKNDVVCVVSHNNDFYCIAILAIWAAGGIFTGTSDGSPSREILNVINDTGAKFIITSINNLNAVKESVQHLDAIKILINLDSGTDYENYTSINSLTSYDRSKCKIDLPLNATKDSTAAYLYTSGSTGRPKPIIKTHENILNYAIQSSHHETVGPQENNIWSAINPFCNTGTLNRMVFLLMGSKMAIMPGFNPVLFLQYIQRYKITNTVLVPSAINALINVDVKEYDLSSLVDVVVTGSPSDEKIAQNLPNI